MEKSRELRLDLLKIYATFLVLLLHVGGYIMDLNGENVISRSVLYIYYICEAIGYPAIHLFVMIGSWFMIEKPGNVKRAFRIWVQTWIVSIIGLIIMLFLQPDSVSLRGGGSKYIPIFGESLLVCL